MKGEFYYKEEFPLELRITVENINELRYLRALYKHSRKDVLKTLAETSLDKQAKDEAKKYIENLFQDPDANIFTEIKEVSDEQERRERERGSLLQGEVSEGTQDTSGK